jgi:hypothetical protein
MGFSKRTRWLAGLVAAGAALLLIFWAVEMGPFGSAPSPLPKPNGYEDFVEAGRKRAGDPSKYVGMNQAELQAVITSNREALRLVKLGLNRECRVTTEFSEAYMERHVAALPGLKSLAFLLAAEGRLAEVTNHPAQAAQSYVGVIRLGQESCRGGVTIDKLVGLAMEGIGLKPLTSLMGKLNAEQGREVIRALESLEAKNESIEQVMAQEHRWARKTFAWRWFITRIMTPSVMKKSEQAFIQKAQQADAQRRRLLLDLAIRVYQQENGSKPKALTDLVPAYLKTIPLDPITGTNMVYAP